jgi:hypothetical protein
MEQIDMVRQQPFQRTFDHLADLFSPAIEPDCSLFSLILKPNFVQMEPGRERLQRLPNHHFVDVRTVTLRGV